MRKFPKDPEPAKRLAAFLNNHREVIAAMGFLSVPTLTFVVLYSIFGIAHDRRRILQQSKEPGNPHSTEPLKTAMFHNSRSTLASDRGRFCSWDCIEL